MGLQHKSEVRQSEISRITYLVNLVPYKDSEKRRRQQNAIESIDQFRNDFLSPVNYCASDEVMELEGWITDPTLRLVSFEKGQGKRLPLARDLFDRASAIAEIQGNEWFAVGNSDLVLTPAWKTRARALMKRDDEIIIFPRTETDKSTNNLGLYNRGQDLFLCRISTWERIRSLFHSYILGEAYWDNIFTAIGLSHAKGYLCLDGENLCLHESHARAWGKCPFHYHNRMLATGPDIIYDIRWRSCHLAYFLRKEDKGGDLNESEIRQLISDSFLAPLDEELAFCKQMLKRSVSMGLRDLFA